MSRARRHWELNEEKFLAREAKGDYIILNLESGRYYTLDGAGGLIFKCLLDDCPSEEIQRALKRRYPTVPEGRLRGDLLDLLKELKRKRIIRQVAG